MSERGVTAVTLPVGETGGGPALQAGNLPGGAISGRWAAGPGTAPARAGRWQAWRARFGLAEACGTIAAVIGFTVGYLTAGSLLADLPQEDSEGFVELLEKAPARLEAEGVAASCCGSPKGYAQLPEGGG